ncbi:MAG: S8 family serine peptidase [Planctomycetaceae bacterium]
MARTRVNRSSTNSGTASPIVGRPDSGGDFTGKFLVLLRDDGVNEGLQAIKEATGLKAVCNSADYGCAAVEMKEADESEVFFLDKLKVAVVDADPTQLGGLHAAAAEDGAIIAVEPERIMYALSEPRHSQFPFDYLRGYKDAVNHLFAELTGDAAEAEGEFEAAAIFADTPQFTWGLQATRVHQSLRSGRGVRLAVLDTGFDLDHPDFAGRSVVSQSFVSGQGVNDLNGHGTHCIGTALGFQQRAGGARRYGCAHRGEIYVGKVLNNGGSGGDSGILAGINWAITNQCRVISMSLGGRVQPGEPYSQIYETVAQRALRLNPGTLIVAAAGNDSSRPGMMVPVSRPANCPSIMAVAAINSDMRIASFSNGGINPNGGGIDLAGPGVAVFSSVPEPFPANVQPTGPGRPWPPRYHTISGTSMACPHVAGIAALWLEARGTGTTAATLWQLLVGNARRLSLPSRDVGAGLIQAPN